jgi:riboflavin biosynthesis pyrimidine reductase
MIDPFELLYEEAGLRDDDLPSEIRDVYRGTLGFDGPVVFANFVQTIDGVVALPGTPLAHRVIGDASEADRFVLGLLRACADVVLVGSGTLRASPNAVWTAADAYPPAVTGFVELRSRSGRSPEPRVAVVTASGSLGQARRTLRAGSLVLTTEHGAAVLDGRLPLGVELTVLPGEDDVDLTAAATHLHLRGLDAILSECGPALFGSLVTAGLVDELFLTISPLLAGRSPDGFRPALVDGVELLPDTRVAGRLLGVRRHGSHLFVRYGLR